MTYSKSQAIGYRLSFLKIVEGRMQYPAYFSHVATYKSAAFSSPLTVKLAVAFTGFIG